MNELDKFLETLKRDNYEVHFDYKSYMPDIAVRVGKEGHAVVHQLHHSALSDEEIMINELKNMLGELG